MPRHNNMLVRPHYIKGEENHIRTWFNQPARKRRRADNRQARAAHIFPRPLKTLRPIVRGQTRKYNGRTRFGRGFTLQEIKEAGLTRQVARSVGISVDHRRQNTNVESLQLNVQRLKAYRESLILFPRKEGKPKKGIIADATAEKLQSAEAKKQSLVKRIAGKPDARRREKPVKISAELKDGHVYRKLRLERVNQRYRGLREKRAKEAAEKKE